MKGMDFTTVEPLIMRPIGTPPKTPAMQYLQWEVRQVDSSFLRSASFFRVSSGSQDMCERCCVDRIYVETAFVQGARANYLWCCVSTLPGLDGFTVVVALLI